MDQSLFKKLEGIIQIKKQEKSAVLKILKEEVDEKINEDQIEIKGKKISLFLSSNQKQEYNKKQTKKKLEKEGYNLY